MSDKKVKVVKEEVKVETNTKPESNTVLWFGAKAGINVCSVCRRVLLIGENAGRNIEVANDVIIIGDNIFGEDNKNRQYHVAETLPEISDIYLQDFLNSVRLIVKALKEDFSKHFGEADIQKAVVAIERMANRARLRWEHLLKESIDKADKNYQAK
jgi:hypothetical protein